ncbi:MAG: CoA transferase [Pseudomonadales bacterium]
MRTLQFSGGPRIGVEGDNASIFYASHWLEKIGLATAPLAEIEQPSVVLVAGDASRVAASPTAKASTEGLSRIVLWDFQTAMTGTGLHAAAASGVSWVLGREDGLPLAMPVDVPEKWCGLVGANFAVSVLLEANLNQTVATRSVDISAADTLRSFADQNSGNETEMDADWQRNGRTAVGHGGIYPQGYYPCRDGHVGLIGRSRKDWAAIRDVVGRPAWTDEERFGDPFKLADDSAEVDVLLTAALSQFDRDDLLARAVEYGAPLAPVYVQDELVAREVVRREFFSADGSANLPFEIVPRSSQAR